MQQDKQQIGRVKKVILVAAGKGGVGKSTVSVLLAKQLQKKSYRIGLLDADIYGPSIPTILNIEDKLPETQDGFFVPVDCNGISVMSIGFLIKPDSALVWRGPILSKALNQLLFSTKWEDLDYLIIDMPPGTGDVHISIIQRCIIEGVLIVTTPDKIAIKDVKRAVDLYKKTDIRVLGIIENMSYLNAGSTKLEIFGSGGAEEIAVNFGLQVIAKLPLVPALASRSELHNSSELQIEFEF